MLCKAHRGQRKKALVMVVFLPSSSLCWPRRECSHQMTLPQASARFLFWPEQWCGAELGSFLLTIRSQGCVLFLSPLALLTGRGPPGSTEEPCVKSRDEIHHVASVRECWTPVQVREDVSCTKEVMFPWQQEQGVVLKAKVLMTSFQKEGEKKTHNPFSHL